MNFNLTITDMTEDEFARLFANIKCDKSIEPDMPESDTPVEPLEDPIVADKDGLPWDARIHSSNHQMTAKGIWQRRRGVSDEEFNAVKNELLGVQEPVAPVVAPVVAPAPVAPMSPELAAVNHTLYTPAPGVAPEPIPAPAVEPVSAPVTPVVDSAVLYQTMFDKFKVGMNNGKIGKNDIQDLLAKVNNTFKTRYTSIAIVKDDISAMQFINNELVARGL